MIMVTPWGESDSLPKRRLPPGPGRPRDEVLANQRERLFGAMVASVSARGYRATTVGDLAEMSGVSSRTFYDLFPDKEACFLATLEAIIEAAGEKLESTAPAGARTPPPGSNGCPLAYLFECLSAALRCPTRAAQHSTDSLKP